MLVEHAGVQRKSIVPDANLISDLGLDEYTLGGVVLNAERRTERELDGGAHYTTVSDLAISLCRAKTVRRLAGMRYIRTIDGAELKRRISAKGSRIVIDFSAEWCRPCQMIRRSLAEIASEQKERFDIVRIDIDKTPDVAELYGVRSIPTVVLLRNGRHIETKVGAAPKQLYVSYFLYYFGGQ
ncbi:thioredoxin family protein [Sinorhizobium terangae]|uniref:thioredoxin family protein n=1 Tax=Sinorhizobium terangae TaxID=110322 RepID=UPI0024B190BA|nr:thioredoxin family protein [Sinorhizobium terangae]WFU50706.1 thioredoxin family protein [Sinorhizobium terangae]